MLPLEGVQPHQIMELNVLRGICGARMQQAHQILVDLATAAPELGACSQPRDQPAIQPTP